MSRLLLGTFELFQDLHLFLELLGGDTKGSKRHVQRDHDGSP